MNLSFRTIFGAVLLLVGSVILLIAADQIRTERLYASHGEEIEAVVVKKDLRRATSNTSTSHEIIYRIRPPGSDPVDHTESVAFDTWQRLEAGSRVRVQHLPGDRQSARLLTERDVMGPAIAGGVGTVLLCVGVVLLGMSARTMVPRGKRKAAEGGSQRSRPVDPGARDSLRARKGLKAMAARRSAKTRLTKSFGFWFGSIWLVAGLPFLVATIYLFYDDRRYENDGHTVQGTVLTKDVRRSRSNNSDSTSYHVTYRFTVSEGRTVEGQDQLGRSEWEALTEGGPIQISYLPSRLDSNRVLGQTHLLLEVIFGIIGTVFTLVGGAIVFVSVGSVWSAQRVSHRSRTGS